MASLDLRVELPAHSLVFTVQIPQDATITDVKEAITSACPGSPKPDGQRLISRGRLLQDAEHVAQIWNKPNDVRVVHLAVHPSAWTSTPPGHNDAPPSNVERQQSQQPQQRAMHDAPFLHHLRPTPTFPLPTGRSPSMAFIHAKHQTALLALTSGRITPETDLRGGSRAHAVLALQQQGWVWPAIFDEDYPSAEPTSANRLVYHRVTINGREYLRAQEPVGTPSAVQMHALNVLTYTFPLLSLPLSSSAPGAATSSSTSSHYTIHIPRAPATVPRDVNALLEQFGLGHLRPADHHQPHPFGVNNNVGPNPNGAPVGGGGGAPPMLFNPHRNPGANAEAAALRQLALRGMFIPLAMLVLRTLILVYFVSPARKPIWGIIIGAYITYEAYRAIHNAIVAAARPEEGGIAAADGVGAAAAAAAGDVPRAAGGVDGGLGGEAPQQQQQRQQRPQAGGFAPPGQGQLNSALDAVSHANMRIEEEALTPPPSNGQHRRQPLQAPGLFHKVATFLFLLVTTLHPAVWSRRRNALIQREGRIRTEARGRDQPPPPPYQQPGAEEEEDEAQVQARREETERRERARAELIGQHERRPPWVRDYIERVRATEWVDDI